MNTLFKNGVLIADNDNPCEYAQEVFYDNDTLALVVHEPDGPRLPFITLDRQNALLLLEELAKFLVQDA